MILTEIKDILVSTNQFADNKYLDKYCLLICSNASNKRISHVTASHHVIPQFHYKNAVRDVASEYKVNLKHSDHALAHLYLYLCSVSDEYKRNNLAAIRYILHLPDFPLDEIEFIKNLSEYQSGCEEYGRLNSELQKGKQAGEKNPFYGKHHTEETRKKMREKSHHLSGVNNPNYGKHLSEEAKQRISRANSVNRNTPEAIAKRLKTMDENHSWDKWKDPAYRKKLSDVRKQVWKHSETRQKASATALSRWQDPDYRAKHIQGMINCPKSECPYCKVLYRKGNLSRHMLTCKERK